jgi:hypothetical protein
MTLGAVATRHFCVGNTGVGRVQFQGGNTVASRARQEQNDSGEKASQPQRGRGARQIES